MCQYRHADICVRTASPILPAYISTPSTYNLQSSIARKVMTLSERWAVWPPQKPAMPLTLERALPGLLLSPWRPIERPITPPEMPTKNRWPNPAAQPAKSGYSLWVGNLPGRATLRDLCWLFGTPGLQSIYLIHRTGCAFVNYASESDMEQAITTVEARGCRIKDNHLVIKAQKPEIVPALSPQTTTEPLRFVENRYFICKSLTLADLQSAQITCEWSTKVRNREKLNQAFLTSRNTYLIFSANRTSAFYGYARMESLFSEEDQDFPPYQGPPKEDISITPTELSENPLDGVVCPAGTIVEDRVRACLFWKCVGCPEADEETDKWTTPCRIHWLSPPSSVVSFLRTKNLKNSCNLNKPVKVARDGTEVDTETGRQLCEMFITT